MGNDPRLHTVVEVTSNAILLGKRLHTKKNSPGIKLSKLRIHLLYVWKCYIFGVCNPRTSIEATSTTVYTVEIIGMEHNYKKFRNIFNWGGNWFYAKRQFSWTLFYHWDDIQGKYCRLRYYTVLFKSF